MLKSYTTLPNQQPCDKLNVRGQTHLVSTAKTAKRVHGYLIRLTHEYTDGGMDSRADEY